MNIFLTGEIQVGKTTIINKFLKNNPNINVGGFKTVSNFNEELGVYGGVYILPACKDTLEFSEDAHVGNRAQEPKAIAENFNLKGVEILNDYTSYDLILMDEIGFMESEATDFINLVLEILDSDIPVFGVVKNKTKDLPLKVKNHPKTVLLEVTCENRDEIYSKFEKLVLNELFE